MTASDAALCLLAHTLPRLKAPDLARLLLHYRSPSALWDAPVDEWRALGVPPDVCAAARRCQRDGLTAMLDKSVLSVLDLPDLSVIYLGGDDYPALLAEIHDPPPILYVRGDKSLLHRPQVAIVGSRKASAAGLRAAGVFAAQTVSAGLAVTSGLAQGIDGEAHQTALAQGGKTVAVMATGIDRVYPRQHGRLADAIARQGCLVTEFPPASRPLRWRFPRRNRIISGLSVATLVVEAAAKSGSLISARMAMEQNRPVLAVPHSLFHAGGAGCLQLLRDGAAMACSFEDIAAEIGSLLQWQQSDLSSQQQPDCPDQTAVLALLGYEPAATDTLLQVSPLTAGRTLAVLSELELAGWIERSAGCYMRC